MKLEGKRVLLTGGSRGIGKSIVEYFLSEGAKVIFTYFAPGEEALQNEASLAKEIEDAAKADGKEAYGFVANAVSMEDAEKTVKFVLEKFDGLDILVNNAGITKDNLLLRMSEQDFDAVVAVNLKGVFNYTKAALKPMMKQRYGRIVNMASVVGIMGNPGQGNYVASKAGVIGFTKSSAKELASRNITVNAIAPGYIDTDMTAKLNDQQKEAILSIVPIKRMGTPLDIAKAAAFLASDDAEYITGEVLRVDGGMAM